MSEKVLTAEELVEDNIILINEINWENMNPRLPRITIRKIINPEDALEFIRIAREKEKERMALICVIELEKLKVRVREETAKEIFEALEKYFSVTQNEDSYEVYSAEYFDIKKRFLVKSEVQKK